MPTENEMEVLKNLSAEWDAPRVKRYWGQKGSSTLPESS